MKRIDAIPLLPVLFATCLLYLRCSDDPQPEPTSTEYKDSMKVFIKSISAWAKGINASFLIIPQNGHELITQDGKLQGDPDLQYIQSVDGLGREDLFYGYYNDDEPSPYDFSSETSFYLEKALLNGVRILVTDYCSTPAYIDDSYQTCADSGYISFAADHRDLDNIPVYPSAPYNENSGIINDLENAKNFLYILDPSGFDTKANFINAITGTNYDILITDLFFDEVPYSAGEVSELRDKQNGGKRLVIAYMSIGEAENYRYYWQTEWNENPPSWMKEENPDWPGNFKVEYWDPLWQQIIFGNDSSYLKKIMDAGFDGVYLDIIDAFEYFE
ncbi:MAG: endo alpha-1,4 polygalactosaminidase [Bacteroidales bacterium]|nr:MAG: endo alpha-1,4 polygalactosaminidase [Bacteroidales bacterium]